MRFYIVSLTGLVSLLAASTGAVATEDEALMQAYGSHEFVTLATGARQPVERAPAVTTVITAKDIAATGATDLDQVLATVPGLHVSVSPIAYNPLYVIRGIRTQYNPQVLMMINSIPITDHYLGDRGQGWGGMPVANIARIEVIRGPSSALYGADAFAGVINIITKTAADLSGTTAGARTGSFNTHDAWALHGGQTGPWQYATALEYRRTDGQSQAIKADSQSYFDSLFATDISNAPGSVNTGRDALDTRLDLARSDWRLRLGYQGRRNGGSGAGAAQALDPKGKFDSDRMNADLSYENPVFGRDWGLFSQVSYFDTRLQTHINLFPPGAFGGAFPEGMIGNPERAERTLRADASTLYSGWSKHQLRIGTGYRNIDLYKVGERKNFNNMLAPFPGAPPPVVDVSDDPNQVYILPHDRGIYYGYLQDAWSFAPDWELTAGLRNDHYSDFGSTVNPRLALVWQTTYRLSSKLLYGRAFRAPSFAELYNINNPVALGNSNLDPETIDTLELAWNYQATPSLRTGLNLYQFKIRDSIQFVADPAPASTVTAQNTDGLNGHGLEWEAAWKANQNVGFSANYAFQQTETELTGDNPGDTPQHQVYLRGDWAFRPDWSLNAQSKWISERERETDDPRSALNGYTLVDLTLRRQRLAPNWGLALAVHNLFDADAREPSPSPGLIPDDLPLAGRSYFLELNYQQ